MQILNMRGGSIKAIRSIMRGKDRFYMSTLALSIWPDKQQVAAVALQGVNNIPVSLLGPGSLMQFLASNLVPGSQTGTFL
jgi:hypothetical protein